VIKKGNAVLWLHVLCMLLGWGLLLPWGASLANRSRDVGAKGSWYRTHVAMQITGWGCQIAGFVLSIVLVQVYEGGMHFTGPTSTNTGHKVIGLLVVIFGSLQPLNARLRPHAPAEGEAKSGARRAWEVLHKYGGWVCIFFGVLNAMVGCALLVEQNYESGVVGGAAVLLALCLGSLALFFLFEFLRPYSSQTCSQACFRCWSACACLCGMGGGAAGGAGKGTEAVVSGAEMGNGSFSKKRATVDGPEPPPRVRGWEAGAEAGGGAFTSPYAMHACALQCTCTYSLRVRVALLSTAAL
jgi:hypothetical protein